jgi:hypothetical protein
MSNSSPGWVEAVFFRIGEADSMLEEIIEAHGGLERWKGVNAIEAELTVSQAQGVSDPLWIKGIACSHPGGHQFS